MTETISISEAATILGYKDLRSVEAWCEKKSLNIFSEEGINKRYIMSIPFEYARLSKFIQYLKIEYGQKWLDVFQICMKMDMIAFIKLKEDGFKVQSSSNYLPVGSKEKLLLSKLTKNSPEL